MNYQHNFKLKKKEKRKIISESLTCVYQQQKIPFLNKQQKSLTHSHDCFTFGPLERKVKHYVARNYTKGDDWWQRLDLRIDKFANLRADGVVNLLVISLSFGIVFLVGFYLFFVWNGPKSERSVWAGIDFWCSFRQIYIFVFLFVYL